MKIALAFAVLASAAPLQAKTYDIDAAHSGVTFRIKHFVSKVAGRFDKFSGGFDFEKGKPASWKAWAEIDAASINTNMKKRDEHLAGADFFDSENCPKIAFKSTKVTGTKGGPFRLHGELTMHCVTKPVVLDLEVFDEVSDGRGGVKIGAEAKGKVNRKDFGIVWNKTLDNGGFMLGDDVEVTLDIEAGAKPGK